MLQFQAGPPEEHLIGAPRMKRAPEKGNLVATFTSDAMMGCFTHWWRRSTVGCTYDDCAPCEAGTRKDWHAYVACWDEVTLEEFMIELTPPPSKIVQNWQNKWGSLRGCRFKLFRTSEKANGRVMIHILEKRQNGPKVPNGINIQLYLEKLWGATTERIERNPDKEGALNLIGQRPEEVYKLREKALQNGAGNPPTG